MVYTSALFLASLLFTLFTCRSQFYYLLSFSSADSIFNSSKIFLFLLWPKSLYPLSFWKISSWLMSIAFYLFLRDQISLPYKRMGAAWVDTITNELINTLAQIVVTESYNFTRRIFTPCYPHSSSTFLVSVYHNYIRTIRDAKYEKH